MTTTNTWEPSFSLMVGLSEKDKELIQKVYTSARPVIEQVQKILYKEIKKSQEESDLVSKFDSPNWQLIQSYNMGQRSALKTLLKLLNNKGKVDHDL